jgi:CPA2 family monovalent cation:H+ antiporter-2
MHDRKIAIITAPNIEISRELTPITSRAYPQLKRFVVVDGPDERDAFAAAGVAAIIDGGAPPGLDIAAAVLRELGLDEGAVRRWAKAEQSRTAEAFARAEAAE